MKTCVLLHGNFFDISVTIVTGVLLQSETIKQSTIFSPVHKFAKNLHYADFDFMQAPETLIHNICLVI